MTEQEQELYTVYFRWTGQLHKLVGEHLGEHVDVEFFPDDYLIRVYSGAAQDAEIRMFHTVPGVTRPRGEARETVKLPRPEDNPTPQQIDDTFRQLCLAVARVLGISVSKLGLPAGPDEPKKHALL
jgi:hypothetical protein